MNGQRLRRMTAWLALTLFLLACSVPSLASPSVTQAPQVMDSQSLGTSIAETAAAAQTQTVVNLPPSATPTYTSQPIRTPPTFTPSPTFIYLLPTFTPLPTWTPLPGIIIQVPAGTGGAGGNATATDSPFTDREWTCAIQGRSPANGIVVKAGASFYVSITLMNTGTKSWAYNSVDFVYTGGWRIEGPKTQDMPFTVKRGGKVSLESLIIAPEKPEKYNTFWTLQVGKYEFCGMKFSFEVK